MDRAQQMIRVVFFATMLATVLDAIDMDSRLPLTCKNIARDVIINSCKGSRIKRSTQKPDLEDIEEDTKIDAPEVPEDEPRATLQKRQWGMMPGMTSGFGMPEYGMSGIGTEMGSEMDSNSHTTELKLPGVDFHDNRESEMVNEQYGSSGFMPMPYQPMGMGPFYRTSTNFRRTVPTNYWDMSCLRMNSRNCTRRSANGCPVIRKT
ncbi:PREDICTED: uncharacterized protein LOC107186003 isoform X2 [Dufourea novaeangliae]|uniref:uncharacterized protein LOC107186003 isoform X2 n=1 Tax=Dufourea novaeangliae TaxID=178035 RepID=UPI0007671592|nr:PREDICTED: uncharacterized protein LOC107186003 isoform X2 [Dufourea novaeangliae]